MRASAAPRLALGADSRAFLLALIGLDAVVPSATVAAGALGRFGVELEVRSTDGLRALFQVCADDPGEEAWIRTGTLRLSYRAIEGGLPASWTAAVQRNAEARLSRTGWAGLCRDLEHDPEHGRATNPFPPNPERDAPIAADQRHWGLEADANDFFAEALLRRCAVGSLGTITFARVVIHGDNECLQEHPCATGSLLSLAESPWRAAVYDVDGVAEDWTTGGLGLRALPRLSSTDLSETDVIQGADGRARQVLEAALASIDADDPAPVLFNDTCVPVILGEHNRSVVQDVARRSGQRVLYLSPDPRSAAAVFERLVDGVRSGVGAGRRDPRGINLFGFPRDPALDEVKGLLDALDVRVCAVALPQLFTQSLENAPRASLSVFAANAAWEPFYRTLSDAFEAPTLVEPAPYGWLGSRRWLEAIVRALGLPDEVERAWLSEAEPQRAEWDLVRHQARQHRLGLVVNHDVLRYLGNPARTFGVPLLAALEEMGFALEIWFEGRDPERDAQARGALRGCLVDPARHTIETYGSSEHLLRALHESRAQAFFSQHTFDWRLTQAGKARFGLGSFEKGPAGAIRTAKRLVDLARSPFFARYGRYVRRTPTGLRAADQESGGPR